MNEYPKYITIAPQSDLRQKTRVKVISLQQVIEIQKQRYEILND